MMNVVTSLQNARQVLEAGDGPAHGRARGACLMARQALEHAVQAHIEAVYGRIDQPTFTTQLIIIEQMAVEDPKRHALARSIAWTWSALSSACHAHAYPLEPTSEEVDRWIRTIEEFATFLGQSSTH